MDVFETDQPIGTWAKEEKIITVTLDVHSRKNIIVQLKVKVRTLFLYKSVFVRLKKSLDEQELVLVHVYAVI